MIDPAPPPTRNISSRALGSLGLSAAAVVVAVARETLLGAYDGSQSVLAVTLFGFVVMSLLGAIVLPLTGGSGERAALLVALATLTLFVGFTVFVALALNWAAQS